MSSLLAHIKIVDGQEKKFEEGIKCILRVASHIYISAALSDLLICFVALVTAWTKSLIGIQVLPAIQSKDLPAATQKQIRSALRLVATHQGTTSPISPNSSEPFDRSPCTIWLTQVVLEFRARMGERASGREDTEQPVVRTRI